MLSLLLVPGAEILLWQTFWLNPTTGEPEPRPIYEVLSSHSSRKAFAGYFIKSIIPSGVMTVAVSD
jgi:hypothetical protein